MPANLAEKFTLIIPTYNRPVELSRLLIYLNRRGAKFPILVLDSSNDGNRAINAENATKLGLNIRVVVFDPDIPPFEKFWRGSEMVDTEFCSLCADDDLIITDSVEMLITFLQDRRDFSAAHGWYFTFQCNVRTEITSIVYRGGSIQGDDPLRRLRDLFTSYEAVTYCLFRTAVMKRVLREIQPIGSMLGRELLGSALTVVAGKVARLPVFYYGRSLSPSETYVNWHPVDYLISSPDQLFRDYAACRKILIGFLNEVGQKGGQDEISKMVDLIYLRYLANYIKPRVLDYLIDQTELQKPRQEIMRNLWPVLADDVAVVKGFLSRSNFLRKLRNRFAPWLHLYHLRRLIGQANPLVIKSTTIGGQPREYHIHRNFLARQRYTEWEEQTNNLIQTLNAYE